MKKDQVQIGGTYVAKVSGNLAKVRIDAVGRYGGWDGTNVETGRRVHIKSAQRLRRAIATGVVEGAPFDDDGPDEVNDELCTTPRCEGRACMTYLNRRICRICWDAICEERPAATPDAVPLAEALATSEAAAANERSWEQALPGPNDSDHSNDDENESEPARVGGSDNATEAAHSGATNEEHEMKATKKSKTETTSTKAKATKAVATKTPKAPKPPKEPKEKKVSALDAAATVLKKKGEPMRAMEMITAMGEQGLWSSPKGKTPHATLYAAMLREIGAKGKEARFKKIDRGQFVFNG